MWAVSNLDNGPYLLYSAAAEAPILRVCETVKLIMTQPHSSTKTFAEQKVHQTVSLFYL